MTTSIAGRRQDALARLETLRRRRGAAVLDGAPFDDDEIDKAEHEIDALAQAEVEAAHRARDAEVARLAEISESLGADIARKEGERLAAIARAEKGARDLVAGLGAALQAAGEIRGLARQRGQAVPAKLDGPALASRLSQRLVAILATLPDHTYRFGAVEWRSCWRKAEDEWAAHERAELAQDIDQLTKGN